MVSLLSFRRDELVLPEETESDDDEEDDDLFSPIPKEKTLIGVEDAFELVDTIEQKVHRMSDAILSMDKRMNYNIRLIGSIIQENEADDNQHTEMDEHDNITDHLQKKTMINQKEQVNPKMKKMANSIKNKL